MNYRVFIPIVVLVALIGAGIAYLVGASAWINWILLVAIVIGSVPLIIDMVKSLLERHFGVDLLAVVAIVTAVILQQYLAAAVILLMLSGGEALEAYALRRARKDFTTLISNAPSQAHRKTANGVEDVTLEAVVPGDVVVIKPGEIVPVDGEVLVGMSVVDESMLTGESLPLEKVRGATVMSGSVNKQGVLEVRVLRPSAESKYEQILRLVREAEQHRAPFVRLADRYSVWFTSLAFALAAIAWIVSGTPLRALAVLVVATPCPLILATPIAFASGISRAAKRGIIVKSGGELEKLAQAVCVVFDKTGTLTFGVPKVAAVQVYGGVEKTEVVRVAASADQLSTHVLARSLEQHAKAEQVELVFPEEFHETLGQGVQAMWKGQTYLVGRLSWLQKQHVEIPAAAQTEHERAHERGSITIGVAQVGKLIGLLLLEDTIRGDIKQLMVDVTAMGVGTVVMLTGDKQSVADRIAREAGIAPEHVHAEMLPEDKVRIVKQLQDTYKHVVMVGDGVNDAPALATADVGIALAQGSTAASESADIVILVDKAERVGDALHISQRVLSIAKQSIFIGIGLSIVLMFVAVAGYITPVVGALCQEVIDVIVIFNALRVLIVRFSGSAPVVATDVSGK